MFIRQYATKDLSDSSRIEMFSKMLYFDIKFEIYSTVRKSIIWMQFPFAYPNFYQGIDYPCLYQVAILFLGK